MAKKELAHVKFTLLLIKDWDGFQTAMRWGLANKNENEVKELIR